MPLVTPVAFGIIFDTIRRVLMTTHVHIAVITCNLSHPVSVVFLRQNNLIEPSTSYASVKHVQSERASFDVDLDRSNIEPTSHERKTICVTLSVTPQELLCNGKNFENIINSVDCAFDQRDDEDFT